MFPQETALRKLDLLKSEFQEIVALIQEQEEESVNKVKAEEKRVHAKFDFVHTVLGKKKKEIQGERDKIEMTLTESDDITFLKVICVVLASIVDRQFLSLFEKNFFSSYE